MRHLLGLAVLLACGVGTPAAAAPPPPTVYIPLKQRPDRSGFANFITVRVGGGPPGTVLFDTGSTGLRIRAEAVGPDVTLTDTPLTYAYASGNVLTGVLGYAQVAFPGAIPGAATAKPIAIHVVRTITCKPDKPRCTGWAPTEMGVMGTGYGPFEVFNPLAQLPGNQANGFIFIANDVTNPRVRPHLVVGLTPQNTAGFARASFAPADKAQPDGLKAWNTKSVRTCFSVDGGAQDCAGTVFDTGAANGSFEVPGIPADSDRTPVPRGALVKTEVPGVLSLTVPAGGRPWLDRYRYEPPHGHPPGYNAGGLVFRHYEVLFDAVKGEIGFRRPPEDARGRTSR